MKKIIVIGSTQIVEMNRQICAEGGNRYQCYGVGKVESALHSAFYPGGYPFQHGGIACIAGAMGYYLVQAHAFFDGNKRTAGCSIACIPRAQRSGLMPTIFGIISPHMKVILVPISGKELRKIAEKSGWEFKRQTGSHMVMERDGKSFTIPNHKELKKGTEQAILKQMGIKAKKASK